MQGCGPGELSPRRCRALRPPALSTRTQAVFLAQVLALPWGGPAALRPLRHDGARALPLGAGRDLVRGSQRKPSRAPAVLSRGGCSPSARWRYWDRLSGTRSAGAGRVRCRSSGCGARAGGVRCWSRQGAVLVPGVRCHLAPGATTLWGPGRLLVLLLLVLMLKERVKLL